MISPVLHCSTASQRIRASKRVASVRRRGSITRPLSKPSPAFLPSYRPMIGMDRKSQTATGMDEPVPSLAVKDVHCCCHSSQDPLCTSLLQDGMQLTSRFACALPPSLSRVVGLCYGLLYWLPEVDQRNRWTMMMGGKGYCLGYSSVAHGPTGSVAME